MENELKPVSIDGISKLELKVRNIDGEGVLFTQAGEIIGHQIANMGHYYYIGHGAERVKYFRATFKVDSMPSDLP